MAGAAGCDDVKSPKSAGTTQVRSPTVNHLLFHFPGSGEVMKFGCGAFFFALAVTTFAHADSVVSGTVSLTGPNYSCSQSGSSGTSLSLSCADASSPSNFASLTGSATPTVVQGALNLENLTSFLTSYHASGSLSLSMDGLYMLTGGTGYGYANWAVSASPLHDGSFGPCSVTFGGVTQFCDPSNGLQMGSFYVPYDTPLQLDFLASYNVPSIGNVSGGGQLVLSVSNLQPVVTPEPKSMWLVGLGVFAIAALRTKWQFA